MLITVRLLEQVKKHQLAKQQPENFGSYNSEGGNCFLNIVFFG